MIKLRAGRTALVASLVLALAGGALAAPAAAGDGVKSTTVARNNNGWFRSVEKVQFTLSEEQGPKVSVRQRSVATSDHCVACNTAGINLDVVLVDGPLAKVKLAQRATAKTTECVRCDTVAANRLIFVGGDGDVQLSSNGRAELEQLGAEAEAMPNAGLGATALLSRVDDVVTQAVDVLSHEITVTPPAGSAVTSPAAAAATSAAAAGINAPRPEIRRVDHDANTRAPNATAGDPE